MVLVAYYEEVICQCGNWQFDLLLYYSGFTMVVDESVCVAGLQAGIDRGKCQDVSFDFERLK